MKPGGGQPKGTSFEREVSKSLSLWISNGRRDDVFWRSAMSGGRATIGLRRGQVRTAQAGDISAIDPLGNRLLSHVIIECKSYGDLKIANGLFNDSGRLYRFWFELRDRGKTFNRRPMLIARQNNLPTVCLLQPSVAVGLFSLTSDYALVSVPRWDCCIILFECFLRKAAIPHRRQLPLPSERVRLTG